MRHGLPIVFILSASLCGCSGLRYVGFLFAPSAPMKTVPAEYDMKGKTLAVVVFARPETLLEYPQVYIELFDAVRVELKNRVRNVTLVDPRRVVRYQDANPNWDSQRPEKLCRVFGCDAVLLISLIEFSTREPGSIHLARGRITAEASVYEPDRTAGGGGRGGCVWRSKTIRVIFPPKSPVGLAAEDDWKLRLHTERLFAAALVKSFYKHKVPKE
ncbi:MAG: hypothetical protein B1H04_01090 [Planctomycetales bacterium 4484_123]|nr:MAG: hypothetical protein B1H04_01090 [Planctomycetales bacterium 4484_123]